MTAILLHPADNILVVTAPIRPGAIVMIDDAAITSAVSVDVGHKIARHALCAGDPVIKYGAPIGSMTAPAAVGAHVHLHNMKSDYIASHLRDTLERSST